MSKSKAASVKSGKSDKNLKLKIFNNMDNTSKDLINKYEAAAETPDVYLLKEIDGPKMSVKDIKKVIERHQKKKKVERFAIKIKDEKQEDSLQKNIDLAGELRK